MFHEGQTVGLYTLIKRIGRGGFGEVWLAERRAKFVTTKVAVKLPLEEQIDVEAIKQEALLWEQASGHPNVLPIIDADEYDGQIVIVSEYAPDGSLEELIKKEGSMPTKKAVELAIGVLSGLEFLHSKNIIHRDVKPANILLQGETPRLADFGISRTMKTTSVSVNMSGTPAYMAPEAFDRERSAQTDIWSVGVILYQTLKGEIPFPHENLIDLLGTVIMNAPEPLPDTVPPRLKEIVFKALAKKPEERYRTAREMRDELANFLISYSHQSLASISPPQNYPSVAPDEQRQKAWSLDQVDPAQTDSIPNNFGKASETNDLHRTGTQSGAVGRHLAFRTQEQGSEVTRQSNEMIAPPPVYSSRPKASYFYLKILAPAIVLILLIAGGGLIYLMKRTAPMAVENQIVAETNPRRLLFPYRKGDKYGFSDEGKNIVIEAKYDFVRPFSEGRAIISVGFKYDEQNDRIVSRGKFGVIDETGQEIVPPVYDSLSDFSEGVAVVNKGLAFDKDWKALDFGKYGAIDSSGKEIIPPKYDEMRDFKEGLAMVELNNKIGFVDKTGNIIIPIIYDDAQDFSKGFAVVNKGAKRFRSISDGQFYASVSPGGKYGYIDAKGNVAIPIKFKRADSFQDGLAAVSDENNCGYINAEGNVAIPLKFLVCRAFSEGLAAVRINDKFGFIDVNGKEVIAPEYDAVSRHGFSEGLVSVKVGKNDDAENASQGKWGFIDRTGRKIVPPKYAWVSDFRSGLAAVNVGWNPRTASLSGDRGKWGFIDKTGSEVIPLKYELFVDIEERQPFEKGTARVVLNKKQFHVDAKGTEYYEP